MMALRFLTFFSKSCFLSFDMIDQEFLLLNLIKKLVLVELLPFLLLLQNELLWILKSGKIVLFLHNFSPPLLFFSFLFSLNLFLIAIFENILDHVPVNRIK